MDPSAVKELLQSSDVGKLEETVRSFDDFQTTTENDERQLIKLRILIWNRICGLQQGSGADATNAFRNIGKCWMDMGEVERAVGQLKRALEASPEDAISMGLLGEAYAETSDYTQAVEFQQKAIGILEKDTDKKALALAYNRLANTYNVKCDFADAVAYYQKAESTLQDAGLAETADMGSILGELGALLEKTGEYEQAVEVFTRAHKVFCTTKGEDDPKTEEIAYLLEMASNLVD